MAYEGYIEFAGIELVNSTRTATYARAAGIQVQCTCAHLPAAIDQVAQHYTDPWSDGAEWVDPGVPESKDFLGLLGMELTGASDGTGERQWTELLGDGGRGGALRRGSREIEVKATAIAASDAALSYGLAWLASALRGSNCQTNCAGDTLCLFSACPAPPLIRSGDGCSGGGVPDPDWRPYEAGTRLLRQLFDVSLIEGPAVESRTKMHSAYLAEVTFTIKAGQPWWYHSPSEVVSLDTPPNFQDMPNDYDILEVAKCPQPYDCLADQPFCRGNGPWGDEPFPGWGGHDKFQNFIDPCYPTALFPAIRSIWKVPPTAQPGWLEKAPVITLYSGAKPLQRVTVRWYTNPQGRDPDGNLDPCTACAEMTIPFVPAQTTLTLDGRVRQATVDCRGAGATTSGVVLYGPRGGLYTWPTFDCATPLFCEVICDRRSLAPDMEFSISLSGREDAC